MLKWMQKLEKVTNKTKTGNHALSEAFSFQDLPLSESFCIPYWIAPGGNWKLSGDCRWGGALDGSEEALVRLTAQQVGSAQYIPVKDLITCWLIPLDLDWWLLK